MLFASYQITEIGISDGLYLYDIIFEMYLNISK